LAYEVIKRVRGREYRYVVEAYRDPVTKRRKARWRYVGVVKDDARARPAVRTPRNRVSREDIIAATARLLEFRSPENVTVSVILSASGASRSAFYRSFPNRQKALSAAIAQVADDLFRTFPTLVKPRSRQDAEEQLQRWCEAHYRFAAQQQILKRAMAQGYSDRARIRFDRSLLTEDPSAQLATFLKQIDDAAYAKIESPLAVARAIRGVLVATRVAELLAPPGSDLPLPEVEDVYALVKRSVFGPDTES
jgi:AcrR family transcriptional regulator